MIHEKEQLKPFTLQPRMTRKLVRTAVIGTSPWAELMHYWGLKNREEVEFVAICGKNLQKCSELAKKFDVPYFFNDYREMLRKINPEVVIIVTPHFEHKIMTLDCLENGSHVICEKPLGLNQEEAKELFQTAEKFKRKHLTFYTLRGTPGIRYIKKMIEEESIGRCFHISISYLSGSWQDLNRPGTWKMKNSFAGGGALIDRGSHIFDLLHWWFSPIKRVIGNLTTFGKTRSMPNGDDKVDTDDASSILATLESGEQASIQVSRVAGGWKNHLRIEIYGSKGSLVFENEDANAKLGKIWGATNNQKSFQLIDIPKKFQEEWNEKHPSPGIHKCLTNSFFESIRDNTIKVSPNFEDGWHIQKIICAIKKSFQSKNWEELESK